MSSAEDRAEPTVPPRQAPVPGLYGVKVACGTGPWVQPTASVGISKNGWIQIFNTSSVVEGQLELDPAQPDWSFFSPAAGIYIRLSPFQPPRPSNHQWLVGLVFEYRGTGEDPQVGVWGAETSPPPPPSEG